MKRLAATAISLMMTAAIGTAAASPWGYGSHYQDGPYGRGYYDTARVVSSTPIVEIVNGVVNTRRCYDNDDGYVYGRNYDDRYYGYSRGYSGYDGGYGYGTRYYNGNSGVTGAKVLGALVGGALGHSVGKGDGRIATTAVDAAIGYAVAANINSHDRGYDYDRDYGYWNRGSYGYGNGGDYCRVEADYRPQRRVVGYDVTYDYHGHIGQVRSAWQPGRTIEVRVDVRPAG